MIDTYVRDVVLGLLQVSYIEVKKRPAIEKVVDHFQFLGSPAEISNLGRLS